MKSATPCLQASEIVALLSQADAGAQCELWEAHISACEHCRTAMAASIGGQDWWHEAEQSLMGISTLETHGSIENEGESIEELLKLLGPTDDPRMLGRIGFYEVLGVLGRGGMGVVFKAFDASLNRFVAIKMLLPHLAASGPARKRFAREGQAVAAVVDDHVMAIHCVDEWQGVPYLVMTYSRGISLQKRLNDQGPLEVREILRIGMQAAKGLAAAHAQGIVHRDIKPANIFLDQNVERVQLMDFGLARAIDDASLTRSGTLAGTPQYMSPEQARSEVVDHRSDLFSLGSVLYAMCTGHSPFRSESSYGTLRLITDKEPRPIRELNPDIPDWFCTIINKLMAKHVHERFQSAKIVAELLEACLAHLQSPAISPLPLTLRNKSLNPIRPSTPWFFGAFIMSCLALSFFLFFTQIAEPPDTKGTKSIGAENNDSGQSLGSLASNSDQEKGMDELQLEARKALQKSLESLRWMQKFDMLVTHQYRDLQHGKVTEKEHIRRDAPRMVVNATRIFEEKPNFAGNLTDWSMDDGEMFISRSTSIGQKKLTGGVTVKRRLQEHWKMLEASGSFAMEGHSWGNGGESLLALLAEAKQPEVRRDKVVDQDCLKISNRSEWGTMTAWIEAGPLRRLLKWECRKERGNRYGDSRVGEDKNTLNLESFERFVDQIKYDTIDGMEIAISCRIRDRFNPGGGKEQDKVKEYLSEYRRTDINLRPDFTTNNPFTGDFDQGARITDWDSHDRNAAYRWSDGKLTK